MIALTKSKIRARAARSVYMEKHLGALDTLIRGQVELYEERMSSAMAEGNEKDMRKINDAFEKEVGKNVSAFAEMAGEPLRSFLLSLFNNPCAKI